MPFFHIQEQPRPTPQFPEIDNTLLFIGIARATSAAVNRPVFPFNSDIKPSTPITQLATGADSQVDFSRLVHIIGNAVSEQIDN